MTRTLGRWVAMLGLLAGTLTPALATSSTAHASGKIPDTRLEFGAGEIHPKYYPHWCLTGNTAWRKNQILYVAQCSHSGSGQVWQITRYVPVGLTLISPVVRPDLCVGQKSRLFTWWAVKAVDCTGADSSALYHLGTSIDHAYWIITLFALNRYMSSPPTLRAGKEYALMWAKSTNNPRVLNQHWILPPLHLEG